MSSQAVAWALDRRQTGPIAAEARLVLVALADYADPTGRGAYPSVATLADRLGVTTRAVRRSLSTLDEAGLIGRGDQRLVEHLRADRRPVVWDLALVGVQLVVRASGDIIDIGSEPYREDHDRTRASARKPVDNRTGRGDVDVTPLGPRGDVHGRHGVTSTSPKPRTEQIPLTHLPTEGDPDAREAQAVENRQLANDVPRDPWAGHTDRTSSPRPLGTTSLTCPGCGHVIGRTHHCRASALTAKHPSRPLPRVTAPPPPTPELVPLELDLDAHDPCTDCGVTTSHRPLTDNGLCVRCRMVAERDQHREATA